MLVSCFYRKGFTVVDKQKTTCRFVDTLYFTIVSLSTVGYGDIVPKTTEAKYFTIIFVLIGIALVNLWVNGAIDWILKKLEKLLSTCFGPQVGSYVFDAEHIGARACISFFVVILCISAGAVGLYLDAKLGFHVSLSFHDSVYASVMSVTTVGYGDYSFKSLGGRIFAAIWLLLSTVAVNRAVQYMIRAWSYRRQMIKTKQIIDKDLIAKDYRVLDSSRTGVVRKSDYILYKLKEMETVHEYILKISDKFDTLTSTGELTYELPAQDLV